MELKQDEGEIQNPGDEFKKLANDLKKVRDELKKTKDQLKKYIAENEELKRKLDNAMQQKKQLFVLNFELQKEVIGRFRDVNSKFFLLRDKRKLFMYIV